MDYEELQFSQDSQFEFENVGISGDLPIPVWYAAGGLFTLGGIFVLYTMIKEYLFGDHSFDSFLIGILMILMPLIFCFIGLSIIEFYANKSKYTDVMWGLARFSSHSIELFDPAHEPTMTIPIESIRKVNLASNVMKTFLKENPKKYLTQSSVHYYIYLELVDGQKLLLGKAYRRGGIQLGREVKLLQSFFADRPQMDYIYSKTLRTRGIFSKLLKITGALVALFAIIVFIVGS
ncbi:hypothetical protein [Candidatus Lokiarchaeum ossiferum]|uniref:hypothetical protein n=1 Tax=Candidatus Lokiarchaeum ossiferum TaxID=2951803 RepID=UPI00352CF0B1